MIVTLRYEVRPAAGYRYEDEPGMVGFAGRGCTVRAPDLRLPAHWHHSWVSKSSLLSVNAALQRLRDDQLLHITATAEYTAEEKDFFAHWED